MFRFKFVNGENKFLELFQWERFEFMWVAGLSWEYLSYLYILGSWKELQRSLEQNSWKNNIISCFVEETFAIFVCSQRTYERYIIWNEIIWKVDSFKTYFSPYFWFSITNSCSKRQRNTEKTEIHFLLQLKNHHWMSKWCQIFCTFFETASHEGRF